MFDRKYGDPRGLRDPDYVAMSRALGSPNGSCGELLSFLLFDEAFVRRLVEMGQQDASRWLGRHPGYRCRDAGTICRSGPPTTSASRS